MRDKSRERSAKSLFIPMMLSTHFDNLLFFAILLHLQRLPAPWNSNDSSTRRDHLYRNIPWLNTVYIHSELKWRSLYSDRCAYEHSFWSWFVSPNAQFPWFFHLKRGSLSSHRCYYRLYSKRPSNKQIILILHCMHFHFYILTYRTDSIDGTKATLANFT